MARGIDEDFHEALNCKRETFIKATHLWGFEGAFNVFLMMVNVL